MRPGQLVPLGAALLLTLGACDLNEQPEDFFSPENFPDGVEDLKLALAGMDDWYTGGSSQAYYIRGWPILTEVPSDHTIAQSNTDERYAMDSYTLTPSNQWLWRPWKQLWGAANHANVLIERVPKTSVPQATKDIYMGAALFHRALNHFNAVRVWGNVPIMREPVRDFAAAKEITRAEIPEIYAFIAADLEEAIELLPLRWPGSATPDDGRPTRGAAAAMLADVYLNMSGEIVKQNRWADAARVARTVMESNQYSLVPSFADLWFIRNKNGPEHIYSIQFEGLVRNLFTSQSRPSGIGTESGINYWYTTPDFMDSFSDADARKNVTFLTEVTVGTTRYSYASFGNKSSRGAGFERPFPYYGKFYDAGRETIQLNNSRTDLNWPVYRYAEVLLFFAEAENEANGPTGAAYDAINQIRARARLPLLAGLTKEQFREAVRQERSWELAFESKRLFDLKRWGTFHDVMRNDLVGKIGVQQHHLWMPIPQRDLDLAPSLGQNPGY